MMDSSPQKTTSDSSMLSKEDLADLTATAFHEAGHAVMALIVGRTIQKITITEANLPTGGKRLGACKLKSGRSKPTKDWLEDEVLILFGGMVGESHFTNEYCSQGAGQDLRAINRLLSRSRATSERQLQKVQKRLLDKTEYFLAEDGNAQALKLIAKELIERKTISGRAALHFFNQANAGS